MVINIVLTTLVLFLTFYGQLNNIIIFSFIMIFDLIYYFSAKNHKHNTGLLEIDVYANKSGMRNWNSTYKIIFCLTMLFISVFTKRIAIPIYICILLAALTVKLGRVRFSDYIKLLGVPINFAMISLLTILLSFSQIPDGILNVQIGKSYIIVASASQNEAIILMCRILGSLSSLYMISLTTPIGEIIAVLKKCRLPGIFIDIMYLMYRYIFILLGTFKEMNNAAESRLGYLNYKKSIKTVLLIASNLFFISLRKASDSFNAMESRLYTTGSIQFASRTNPIRTNELFLYLACLLPIVLYGFWSSI